MEVATRERKGALTGAAMAMRMGLAMIMGLAAATVPNLHRGTLLGAVVRLLMAMLRQAMATAAASQVMAAGMLASRQATHKCRPENIASRLMKMNLHAIAR